MSARATSLDLTPAPSDAEREAAVEAVARAGVDLDAGPAAYGSRWRAAALREGVERAPGPPSSSAMQNATPGAPPARS